MTKRSPIYCLLVLLSAMIGGCNSDPGEPVETKYDNVAVTSFNLAKDDSVLVNIDSVYFSINLEKGLIYNADSLPKGTKIDRLLVSIGTSTVSNVELIVTRAGLPDTTINYLTNPSDSIDFSNGPVTLRITSYDRTLVRDYKVQVNVHEMEPDSLYWNLAERRDLPSLFGAPKDQKTVEFGGQAVVLTTDGNRAAVAVIDNPADDNWLVTETTLPAGARIPSFTASEDALYILGEGDALYSSTDFGATWTATGVTMSHIYGAVGSTLGGNRRNADGSYTAVNYPDGPETALPADALVSGTSQMLVYSNRWSTEKIGIVAGGRDASGKTCGDTWAYDGSAWVCLSKGQLPSGEDMTVFPYLSFRTNTTTWITSSFSTLFALGGRYDGGVLIPIVYISVDRGFHWSKAGELMQIPDYIPDFYGAQALVFDSRLSVSRSGSNGWQTKGCKRLPAWFVIENPYRESRAITDVTEWGCPFIYLFGGYAADGSLHNNVWRGVINRLSFKPLF